MGRRSIVRLGDVAGRACLGGERLRRRLATVIVGFIPFLVAMESTGFAEEGEYIQLDTLDGLICIEAEDYVFKKAIDGNHWEKVEFSGEASSGGAMQALPDTGDREGIDYYDSPYIDYKVNFIRTGTHYVWMRGKGLEDGETAELDIDRRKLGTATEMAFEIGRWSWASINDDDEAAHMKIEKTGLHTISLCMHKDGAIVDKIILTTNPDFRPEGVGAPSTSRGGVFSFYSDQQGSLETASEEVSIPVRLERVSKGAYSVDYTVAGGTASVDDFVLENGTLKFELGEEEKSIKVRIEQDDTDELDETIEIVLLNPSGEGTQLGAYPSIRYSIIDPRPIVEFGLETSGVAEEEGFIDVPLRLSRIYNKSVTVQIVVTGGSADENDFSLESTSVTFRPGQLESALRIRVASEGAEERAESIELRLLDAENATLLGRNQHSVIICTRSYSRLGGAHYFRYTSGERWETYAKVGKYADAMVRLEPGDDRLVFWRGSSYLPFMDTADGKRFAEVEVAQKGDGEGVRFDLMSKHAHTRIVEASDARVRIVWRYIPDMEFSDPQDWTEETFTIYPDGACYRDVMEGTETLEEFRDPDHSRIRSLLLTDQGISPMPRSWDKPVTLEVDDSSLKSYRDEGYNYSQGCYEFSALQEGAPKALRIRLKSDVVNPALSVLGWGDAEVSVSVDGRPFEAFEQGAFRRTENNDLVLWLGNSFSAGSEIVVRPVGGSDPVVRAPVRDPYLSEIPLLPEGSTDPGLFGAYYKTLKYWEEWDAPWRTGDFADVVVQFDGSPDRLVFWRGATYVPHWVNERNFWYENEFCERRGDDSGVDGLCEPMQDHESRFSRVKIIHTTPARALVHWRYAPTTLTHQFFGVDETGWGDWVDDYYYVYPDETCVRDTTLYTSMPNVFNEFHEAIPVINPGMLPEDILEPETIEMGNSEGDAIRYDFSNGFPSNDSFEDGLNILLVRLKGESKPFAIAESAGQWFDPISRPDDGMFNHYDDWPAWPKQYRRNDWERDPKNGYREFWKTLPSHSSLMHLDWDNYESDLDGPVTFLRKILLNGMTREDSVAALIPLTRYWENAPMVKVNGYGFGDAIFDKAQKAYVLKRRISWIDEMVNRDDDKMINGKADEVTLQVYASKESPMVNPCFVIKNWPAKTKANLLIDGEVVPTGKAFRQGIEEDWGEFEVERSLVAWVECEYVRPVTLTLRMVR
jgi:hypothetical protein